MTNSPIQKHVFMSYSRKDNAVMRRIVKYLRKQGINVWVDNEKLVPGTPIWEVEIEKAIKNASAVIVILSPDSKNSEWVRREISLANQYRTRIFPVLVRGDEDSSITIRLITSQYVDLRHNERTGLNKLDTALTLYLDELKVQERKEREKAERLAREKAERKAEAKAACDKVEQEQAIVTKEEARGLRKTISLIKHSSKSRIIAISGVFVALVILGFFANNIFKITKIVFPSAEANPFPGTGGERAWGIDVSSWEGQVNWNQVKNEGTDFAVVKATEGTNIVDGNFQKNWDALEKLEIARGAYHYFLLDEDPKQQANFFASQITLLPGDLPPVLDIEVSSNLENNEILSNLQIVLTELELKTEWRPIVYTNYDFLKENLRDSSGNYPNWLIDYPLWIAQYPNNLTHIQSNQPRLPPGWKGGWLFWRYADNGTLSTEYGITNVNMNLFNGSPIDLQEFLDISKERAWGIDVSLFENNINWDNFKDEGIDFVYVNATQGKTITNQSFENNWNGAKSTGIQRGACHVFDPDIDPAEQADYFIQIFRGSNYDGELPPVVKVETIGTQSSEDFLSKLQNVLNGIEEKTGQQPIIHTNYYFLEESLRNQTGNYPEWLTQYPLWIDQYPAVVSNINAQQPYLPDDWSGEWVFWSYSNTGIVSGIDTKVNLTLFKGSTSDFKNLPLFLEKPSENSLESERAWGIDVSSLEGKVNWAQVKSTGVDFVFVRANSGTTVDATFQQNWEVLKEVEILRGAYMDFNGDENPELQVEAFASQVELLPEDLPPALVIDYIGDESLTNQEILTNLRTALIELEHATDRQPIIYSGRYFTTKRLIDYTGGYPDWLTKYPLWIPHYFITDIETSQPILLNGWKSTWLIWQYTERGQVDGIENFVDLNVFNGSVTELHQFLNTP